MVFIVLTQFENDNFFSFLQFIFKLNFDFSDYTQIVSIIVSFLSLTLSSIKLFYSQRLGIFLDVDPSPKMLIYAALPIFLQLLFPIFSLILMASYLKEYVLLSIGIIMLANFAVLKSKCLKEKLYCHVVDLYGMNADKMKEGLKEFDEIFNTAILTSWISPCTVWSNNFEFKSYFLIVNSLTTLLGHAVGIASVFILTHFGVLLTDLAQSENPPVTHCFKGHNISAFRFLYFICFTFNSQGRERKTFE